MHNFVVLSYVLCLSSSMKLGPGHSARHFRLFRDCNTQSHSDSNCLASVLYKYFAGVFVVVLSMKWYFLYINTPCIFVVEIAVKCVSC